MNADQSNQPSRRLQATARLAKKPAKTIVKLVRHVGDQWLSTRLETKLNSIIVGFGLFALLMSLLPLPDHLPMWLSSVPLYTVSEAVAVVLAILIYAIGWTSSKRDLPCNLVVLACAFLAAGLIDLVYSISLPISLELGTQPDRAAHFWIAARFCAAVGLLASAWLPWRPNELIRPRHMLRASTVGLTMVVAWFGLYQPVILSNLTRTLAEAVVISMYIAAAILFYRRLQEGRYRFLLSHLYAASLITAYSEILITLFPNISSMYNLLGHAYKLVAYYLLYRSVLAIGVNAPFERLYEAQEELKQSNERLSDLTELASDWYWEQNSEFRFTLVSNGLVEKIGLPALDMIGKRHWEIGIAGLNDSDWAAHAHILEQRQAFSDLVYQWNDAAGRVYWFSVSGKPHFNAQGGFVGYRGIGRDITALKLLEIELRKLSATGDDDFVTGRFASILPAVERSLKETRNWQQQQIALLALRENDARFKAIISNIPGMVFQMAMRKNGPPVFNYVNDGCQPLLNVKPEDLLGTPGSFEKMIVPEDLRLFKRSMLESAERLLTWNWEGRITVAGVGDDDLKWINLRSSPRRIDSEVTLWEGIMSNITQSKLSEIEVRDSREQLRNLSAHIDSAKEHERMRIAREIHDDIGGTLTAIKIELMRLARQFTVTQKEQQGHVHSIDELVDAAMESTRRISTELRPGILDLGIVAAVEWQAAEFERRLDIPCIVHCSHEDLSLHGDISIVIFRTFQEALTNIAKHAQATHVEVELETDATSVMLTVTDDGRGFSQDARSKPRSFGILGMLERARNAGGDVAVESRVGKGTKVSVRIPTSIQVEEDTSDAAQLVLFSPDPALPVLPQPVQRASFI